jgi:hypothetical protein
MINSSIAMGVKPVEIESPVNAIAKMMQMQATQQQLKDAQQQNQLNTMKMAEYGRTNERQNALRSLLGGMPNATDEQRVSALRGGAYFDEADKLDTGILNRRKTESEARLKDVEAEKYQIANAHTKLNFGAQLLSSTKDQASYDAARAEAKAYGLDTSRMPAMYDPAFVAAKLQESQTVAQQLEQKWKAMEYTTPTANTRLQADTSIATNKLTNETSRANNSASVGATIRVAKMADERAREKNTIDSNATGKVDWKQDTEGNWVALPKEIKPGEKVTPGTAAMPGKRAAQASQAINILDEADKLISSGTSSYIGAGVDQAARLVGASTKGAQGAAQLKALEGALMMAQPRMEGPQSNLDVNLYRQMAGQIGDPTVPVETKKAALKSIRALHSRYATNPTVVTQDQQARDWAQANPNDPRSKAIMQRLGGG